MSDAVLGSMGDQRKNKLAKQETTNLQDEFADVLIVLFMLAKAMDVDIMQALDDKVQKIRERNRKR